MIIVLGKVSINIYNTEKIEEKKVNKMHHKVDIIYNNL